MGIGDWAQSPIPQSPIPNPQSPIPKINNQFFLNTFLIIIHVFINELILDKTKINKNGEL